jgi:hypothetical protein
MEDEPQLDTVLRAIDNNTCHARRGKKKERNGIYGTSTSSIK